MLSVNFYTPPFVKSQIPPPQYPNLWIPWRERKTFNQFFCSHNSLWHPLRHQPHKLVEADVTIPILNECYKTRFFKHVERMTKTWSITLTMSLTSSSFAFHPNERITFAKLILTLSMSLLSIRHVGIKEHSPMMNNIILLKNERNIPNRTVCWTGMCIYSDCHKRVTYLTSILTSPCSDPQLQCSLLQLWQFDKHNNFCDF